MSMFCRWSLAGLIVASAGCGGGYVRGQAVANVVPVSGVLTYQSQPLADFVVSFSPSMTDGHAALGTTDASGKFTLGTNKPGDGAAVGKYHVFVTYSGPQTEDSSATTGPVDDPNLLPKSKVKIPEKYQNPETSEIILEVPPGGLPDLKLELK